MARFYITPSKPNRDVYPIRYSDELTGYAPFRLVVQFCVLFLDAFQVWEATRSLGQFGKDVNNGGPMLAVRLGADKLETYFDGVGGQVVSTCYNSPSPVTLFDDADALSVFARPVEIDVWACHRTYINLYKLLC